MKYLIFIFLITLMVPKQAHAFFGGVSNIPFLIEIVANTLNTLREIRGQTKIMRKEMEGIDDKIKRLEAIRDILQPDNMKDWKDPRIAARRLREIYINLPDEFKTKKSDEIERQLSEAIGLSAQLIEKASSIHKSGKEIEKMGLEKSPGVAQKLTASGIGTLITLESQNQVAQATIISLLSQMIAEEGSKEAARLKSQSEEFKSISKGMTGLSKHINLMEVRREQSK